MCKNIGGNTDFFGVEYLYKQGFKKYMQPDAINCLNH